MKNPKPIFIVRIPKQYFGMNEDKKQEIISDLSSNLNKMLEDEYHVLIVVDRYCGSSFLFECFNAKDAKDIDIDTLQKRILSLLENNTTNE